MRIAYFNLIWCIGNFVFTGIPSFIVYGLSLFYRMPEDTFHDSDGSSSYGCSPVAKVPRYAMFSDHYTQQHLTKASIQEIYRQEIHDILREGEFMGVWQLMALASVLRCPIFSVYPAKGCPGVRDDLHRLIMPRELITTVPSFILWSCTRDDLPEQYWTPNHFSLSSHDCHC